MSPEARSAEAWRLTRAIAPRAHVRVASIDASGAVLNQYSRTWPLERAIAPGAPWAVPLADTDGFRLIAFDLDAKCGEEAADNDTRVLGQLLDSVGIPHLVCRSGPAGGRHVWTATTTPIDPSLIGTLARLAAALLPSLDIAPLRNSATGCVRPPGSPHRDGGYSELLSGDPDCLLQPSVDQQTIERLVLLLAEQVTGSSSDAESESAPVRFDGQGHPYLPGARRPLPPASSTALSTPVVSEDASAVLNRLLLGAAASHWRLADIADLVPTAAGLEHIRTRRTSRGRTPRQRREQAETLARQWRYAVRFVADHPRQTGLDATFDTRAGALTDLVRDRQEHADAAIGRWTRGGGPTDRRVLDCLHRFALTAVTADVEADIRRIALGCGIGRETARTALLRLAAEGWICQVKESAGVHGATWSIDPLGALHSNIGTGRSQAATRPEGAGAAERLALLQQLQARTDASVHDVFTGTRALSFAAGDLFARLCVGDHSTVHDQDSLQQLQEHGLVRAVAHGWIAVGTSELGLLAQRLGVVGRLQGRHARYLAERAAWSWWQAEHEWMRQPRNRRERRARPDQTPLWQATGSLRYPKHPRGPDGRADYSAARRAVDDGALSPTLIAA